MNSVILPKARMLSRSRLHELLSYAPDVGVFEWKSSGKGRKSNSTAGCNSHGYTVIRIDGVSYLAHRLAWLYVNGEFPSDDIDHINGKKSDNRIANLRVANPSQNLFNTPKKISNQSGFKGVYKCKNSDRWRAEIKVNKTKYSLGSFKTAQEAGKVYDDFARIHHGDFYFKPQVGDQK